MESICLADEDPMTNVFISSTGLDLKDYRQAAFDTCLKLGFQPIAMEFFEAMGVGASEGSKRKLDDADLYVGIFAHRYGYIENGYKDSVTVVEFDYAGKHHLDRLCFLVDPNFPWSPAATDYKHYQRLEDFKARIDRELIRSYFTTVEDFTAKLMHALVEWEKQHPDRANILRELSVSKENQIPRAMPPFPSLLVGREQDLKKIKSSYLGISITGRKKQIPKQPVTVIHGWPGVGKTTFAAALAYDGDINTAFSKNILWVSLGANPDLFSKVISWWRTMNFSSREIPKTLSDAIEQLTSALKDKQALLIIDDVWEATHAAPFLVGGVDCTTVITTRFMDVARNIALNAKSIYKLDVLSKGKSLKLLEALAPTVVNQYRNECLDLVNNHLEGLPLAIQVAGRLLETEATLGWGVKDLLADLPKGEKILETVPPPNRSDASDFTGGTSPTVNLLLAKSTDRLDQESRRRFALLGAFAPKPASFDLTAMSIAWRVTDPKPTTRLLVDRGLLEPIIGSEYFQMHAVLVMHALSLFEKFGRL